MSKYLETMSKHRRLTILKFLSDCPEYTSNASMLNDVCNDFGVSSTRDQITGELEWLKEQGFVTTAASGDFIVAIATGRGVDIADGKARHDGVRRPRPGT